MFKMLSLLAMTALLCGCHTMKQSKYVKDHEKDYLVSHLSAPLKIPEALSTPTPTENYPIPADVPAPGMSVPPSLDPPGFGKLS